MVMCSPLIRPRVTSAVFAVVLATACGATDPAPTATASGSVTTDRSEYQWQNGMLAIVVHYRNDADSARYLGLCGYEANATVERLEGQAWTPLLLWWCPAVKGPAIVVPPGESRSTTVRLTPSPDLDASKLTGTFRVRLDAYTQVDEDGYAVGTPLDGALTTSAAFTLTD